MNRRQFLTGVAAGGPLALAACSLRGLGDARDARTFASPADAQRSAPETLAYVMGVYTGTGIARPDYIATVDLDAASPTFSQIVHRLEMPNVGDELHHFGWNACGSCHGDRARRFLIVPGLVSGRIHIIDTQDPRAPRLTKVIEAQEVVAKTKLTAPHTVHCLADGRVMISMLGDERLQGPGGFLLLDDDFEIAGRWEASTHGMNYNYDYWYQPRHNVMVSSEWGAPATTRPGFKLDDVKAGKYGHHLHFWNWSERTIAKSIDLGEQGMIPLEVRFHHDPDSTHGYVGAALSSVLWHFHKDGDEWRAEPVVSVEAHDHPGWDFPVPGLISDLLISMDDRWLYFANWLHGDLRQYDISEPAKPKLAGQLWLGGVLGHAPTIRGKLAVAGPQMLQLSLDGKRLYVTDSLFSSWDDQFYPDIVKRGSTLLRVDVDTEKGGMTLNDDFFVDFGKEPGGPARAHEIRFPFGDSTSDVWS